MAQHESRVLDDSACAKSLSSKILIKEPNTAGRYPTLQLIAPQRAGQTVSQSTHAHGQAKAAILNEPLYGESNNNQKSTPHGHLLRKNSRF